MKAKNLFLGLFVVIFMTGNAYSFDNNNFSISISNKSNNEYQLAKSTFLPETFDDLGLSGRENTKYDHNRGENCVGYNLSSCPAKGNCSSCAFNRSKKKLVSCSKGYTKNGDSCTLGSCSSIGYDSSIPANKICTKITESGMTCYKDCKAISCSGYTLNCDSFNVANSSGKAVCPDCESANANCSPKLCKVKSCQDGYKIANNGTSCVALDDTCPDGYFKSCETGTQGNPEYTEARTACYKCQPKTQDNGCPKLTPAQKCIEEGYKTMSEWNALSPNGGKELTPNDSEFTPIFKVSSNDIKNIKLSKLTSLFREFFGIKNASATSMISACEHCRLTGCSSASCLTNCPEDCGIQVLPMISYVFDKTAVCPYDTTYVKGIWTKVESKTELPIAITCSGSQTRMVCNGVTYCCAINPGSCSKLTSNATCYSRACATNTCIGYDDNIVKTGAGWSSESCMPVLGNCTKGPTKYKNTCNTSSAYTLSSCPENTRCEGDCNNRYKVIGCDCGYTLQNGKCVAKGDEVTPVEPTYSLPVLYSDLTTSRDLVAGKTPIGVVFDESKKLAVAFDTISKPWATTSFDIPDLSTYSTSANALSDWNGKANTKTIIDFCKANSKSCPALEYAVGYATDGTSAGDWYMPALGELNAIYSNLSALNSTLEKVNGAILPEKTYWSSSKYNTYGSIWNYFIGNGSANHGNSTYNLYLLPVINYGDVKHTCSPATKCPTEISTVYSTPSYKVHKYLLSDNCGGFLTCYREKSCDEACPPAQTPSCPCTDSWGNQSTTCSEENIQKCRETCLEHCNKYPQDECWWIGCGYTNILQ